MNCSEIRPLQHAYADGETDALRAVEIEEHLRQCRACRQAIENVRKLKSVLKADPLYYKAPPKLEQQIRAALRAEDRKTGVRTPFSWNWLKLAIPTGIAAFATWAAVITWEHPAQAPLLQEITSSHVRSLMPGHLTDVASTDQHTVKPWFNGKLDFSPRVVDLADHNFPLVGGRLDYLENRPVAALVYQRRKHVINLFVWPLAAPQSAAAQQQVSRQGYNLIEWQQGGLEFWAISDLNARELSEFVQLVQMNR